MREQIAVVFMTVSMIATLGLGGGLVYELSRSQQPAYMRGAAPQGVITGSPEAVSTTPGDSKAAGKKTGGDTGSSGSQGRFVGSGGGSGNTGSGTGSGDADAPGGGGGQADNRNDAGVGKNGMITVGGIFDMTGPVDSTVERDTVRAYFNKVNAQGGVNGYKFRLLACDSKYDPSAGHRCSQKLIEQGVLAIVGWTSPSSEQPEAKYLNSQGVPIIGGLGVPSEFELPLSFPTTGSFLTGGTAMGARAAQLGMEKPGIIILNANFTKGVLDSLLKSLHKRGIQEVGVEEVEASKSDYTDVVLKLQRDGAQSLIVGLDPYSYARLFQAMERQNWDPPFLGAGLDKPSANKAYTDVVHGAHSLTPLLEMWDHRDHPAVKEYVSTLRKYYPDQVEAIDIYSETQWVAAKVFVHAIKTLGNKPVTRANLVNALESMKPYKTGLSKPIDYEEGDSHEPLNCFQWIRNRGGDWRTQSGWNCF